jgi:hypothetical protein
MDAPGDYTGVFRYSYKRWRDHLRGIFSHPLRMLIIALSVFATVWGMYQAADYYYSLDWKNPSVYVALCVFAVVAAIGWEIRAYINECPHGLESLPPSIRKVAHLQPTKWEFEFAKRLLALRIGPIDREYQAVVNGTTYVAGQSLPSLNHYIDWMKDRPENLFQMIEVVKRLLFEEYAQALVSTEEKHASPTRILAATEKLERLYRETVEFERQRRATIPPEPLKRLHELQAGWSQPIRDGIEQLFQFLQRICDADADDDTHIQYIIEFGESPNIEEFGAEVDRLQRNHPELF